MGRFPIYCVIDLCGEKISVLVLILIGFRKYVSYNDKIKDECNIRFFLKRVVSTGETQ